MHILAILLFPVRLVTWPFIVPEITYVMYGLTNFNCQPNTDCSYHSLLWLTTKSWLLWHVS